MTDKYVIVEVYSETARVEPIADNSIECMDLKSRVLRTWILMDLELYETIVTVLKNETNRPWRLRYTMQNLTSIEVCFTNGINTITLDRFFGELERQIISKPAHTTERYQKKIETYIQQDSNNWISDYWIEFQQLKLGCSRNKKTMEFGLNLNNCWASFAYGEPLSKTSFVNLAEHISLDEMVVKLTKDVPFNPTPTNLRRIPTCVPLTLFRPAEKVRDTKVPTTSKNKEDTPKQPEKIDILTKVFDLEHVLKQQGYDYEMSITNDMITFSINRE